VHRYYESRRRKYNDKRPQRVEQVAKVKADEAKRKLRRKVSIQYTHPLIYIKGCQFFCL